VSYNEKKAIIYGNDLNANFSHQDDEIDATLGCCPPMRATSLFFPREPATPSASMAIDCPILLPATGDGCAACLAFANGSSVRDACQTHYDSGEWRSFITRPTPIMPASTKTDLMLTYTFADDKWNVGLWGKNLENTRDSSGPPPLRHPVNSVYMEAPRTTASASAPNFEQRRFARR